MSYRDHGYDYDECGTGSASCPRCGEGEPMFNGWRCDECGFAAPAKRSALVGQSPEGGTSAAKTAAPTLVCGISTPHPAGWQAALDLLARGKRDAPYIAGKAGYRTSFLLVIAEQFLRSARSEGKIESWPRPCDNMPGFAACCEAVGFDLENGMPFRSVA